MKLGLIKFCWRRRRLGDVQYSMARGRTYSIAMIHQADPYCTELDFVTCVRFIPNVPDKAGDLIGHYF